MSSNGSIRPKASRAVLFPGQGSQVAGMRATVALARPALLGMAEDLVGADLFERVGEGTDAAQPAIFCASLARWHALGCPRGAYMTGHSLGELTALVAAGSLTEADGLALATLRGRLMQDAAEAEPGGMLAIRAGDADVEPAAARSGATVANYNSPKQTVVSGSVESLDQMAYELGAMGIRSQRINVAGAFHSFRMGPAVDRYAAELRATDFREPDCTVVSSITARPFEDPQTELAAGITAPVRWDETIQRLARVGVTRFLDVGPGQVLAGLVRRCINSAYVEIADLPEADCA